MLMYACHIHPCPSARLREAAHRVADQVGRTKASDPDDLVDDLLLSLTDVGLEEARIQRQEHLLHIVVDGRPWLTWLPSAAPVAAPRPAPVHELPLAAMALRHGYNPRTLRLYVGRGYVKARRHGGELLITEAEMQRYAADRLSASATRGAYAQRAAAVMARRGYGVTNKRRVRTLLERLLRTVRRRAAKRRSCMRVASFQRMASSQQWMDSVQGPLNTARTADVSPLRPSARSGAQRDSSWEMHAPHAPLGAPCSAHAHGPPGALAHAPP